MLGWSQKHLADKAGLSIQTIKRMENIPGELKGLPENIEKIKAVIESEGIVFTPNGVILDKTSL